VRQASALVREGGTCHLVKKEERKTCFFQNCNALSPELTSCAYGC